MSVTDEMVIGKKKPEPRNKGQMRLALEIAALSNMIRMKDGEYDLEGFRSLPPAMQEACLQVAHQYMVVLALSMKNEGVVNEKNSAFIYLHGDDGR